MTRGQFRSNSEELTDEQQRFDLVGAEAEAAVQPHTGADALRRARAGCAGRA